MKRFVPLLALAGLAFASLEARAQVSSTITLSSDYDFRGISQSALSPALSASLDWSAPSGFYVGAWASNVDFGPGTDADFEVDGLVGFRGNVNDDFGYDVGGTYYSYWGDGDKFAYGELYAGLSYKAVAAKLWFAPDYSNSGNTALYLEGNATIALPADFSLALHAGYSDGDYWDAAYGGGYFDYSIGIGRTIGNFALSLKWVDGSDLAPANNTPGDVYSSDSKVWFSIATTLPW